MKRRTSLIAVSVQALLCLGACQSVPKDSTALKVVPAEQVRHSTSRPDALYAVGRYHQGQVRYDKAIESYQKLLAEYPDHAEARNALGVIYANQGKHAAAIDELEKAVVNAPDSAGTRNNLGYAYLLAGRVGEAIDALEIAAQLDPAHQRVRDNLGIALARAGRGNKDAGATVAAADERKGAATKNVAPPDKIQLVPVAANVFSLQLPVRTSVKTSPLPPPELAAPNPVSPPVRQAEAAATGVMGKGMRLEVSNGNGVTGLAKKTSTHLEESGYVKVRITNEPPYRLAATQIQYRPGSEPQARSLQTALRAGIPLVVSQQLRPDVQVRLLLGKDVKSVAEVAAQTPATRLAAASVGD